jgi:hypothetical protein
MWSDDIVLFANQIDAIYNCPCDISTFRLKRRIPRTKYVLPRVSLLQLRHQFRHRKEED